MRSLQQGRSHSKNGYCCLLHTAPCRLREPMPLWRGGEGGELLSVHKASREGSKRLTEGGGHTVFWRVAKQRREVGRAYLGPSLLGGPSVCVWVSTVVPQRHLAPPQENVQSRALGRNPEYLLKARTWARAFAH